MTLTVRAPTAMPAVISALARAIVAIAVAAAVYMVAVQTSVGQHIDQQIFNLGRQVLPTSMLPSVLTPAIVTTPVLWLTVAGLVVTLVMLPSGRRSHRFAALATVLAYPVVAIGVTQYLRDRVLTRPQLHDWIAETANSAPSGHAAAVTACAVVVARATPRRFRPWSAMVVGTWAVIIQFGLVAAGWHRMSDVIISTVLVAGCAALLPDPHRNSPAAPWLERRVAPALITPAAPVVVAVYFPSVVSVAITGLFAVVMAVCMGALTGRSDSPSRSRTRLHTEVSETVYAA